MLIIIVAAYFAQEMKNILVLGAGRSASVLINYLLTTCTKNNWHLTVGDVNLKLAQSKIKGWACGSAIYFDVHNEEQLHDEVKKSDLVISMLPARFHMNVVLECVKQGINLITASYTTPEMKELEGEAKEKGMLILNECGLDPGIDHMSAMKVLDRIREEGGKVRGFESFTGGLLAPNEHPNPWDYKFTWNPRNVVLAGQGVVKFLQEGRYKYIPYHKIFRRSEMIHIPKYGYFEGYANRDSLKYREVYKLKDIETMYRGTLRRPGFCRAWNVFVQLGATDDSYEIEGVKALTHKQFTNLFLPYNPHDSVELKLAHYMNLDMESEEMHKLRWLGLFEDELVGLDKGTPAQVLEHILKKKWTLSPEDNDMIVMWHKFNYSLNGDEKEMHATLVSIGDDTENTAMAKTVGLPLGIAAKLVLEGKIKRTGVCEPIWKEIYEPVLKELVEEYEMDFIEEEIVMS
jgi:saccharopine dehydrogenase (NADP+, L-glutamate forming)